MELVLGEFKQVSEEELNLIDGGKTMKQWAATLLAASGTVGFYTACCAAAITLGPAGLATVCGYLAASGASGVATAVLAFAD